MYRQIVLVEFFGRNKEDSRTSLGRPVLRRDRGGPQSFEGLVRDLRFEPPSLPIPGYGRDPVGKGQAAAGFSAVRAPGVAAVDGRTTGTGAVGATWIAFLAGFLAAFFFLEAFFLVAFFFAVFFAAFFLAFAMTSSYQVVAQKKPGPNGPDYPTARPDGRTD